MTWRSSITSSSAACVFGDARLISSASTTLENTAPRRKSNEPCDWLYTSPPVTSDGSRSGVNWMRLHVPFTEWAIAFASDVLPVPGTSSSSRWPSLNTHVRASATWSRLPLMT